MSTNSNPSSNVHSAAALGFQINNAVYHNSRPSYNPQIVQDIINKTILNNDSKQESDYTYQIVDLAAGTGKFSEVLTQQLNQSKIKYNLTAVEPVEGMRSKFKSNFPNIPILDGTSTSLPFPSNSIDLLTIAQAFHWFSNLESLTEIHRVLKKKTGAVVLIWNYFEKSQKWMQELDEMCDVYCTEDIPQFRFNKWQIPFTLKETQELYNLPLNSMKYENALTSTGNIDAVIERCLSISYIGKLDKPEQQKLIQKIKDTLANHPETKGKTEFSRNYNCDVYYTTAK